MPRVLALVPLLKEAGAPAAHGLDAPVRQPLRRSHVQHMEVSGPLELPQQFLRRDLRQIAVVGHHEPP